ncbi:hypothetical protein ACIHAA_21290 [Streptomyces sp. NPDC052040]|uniref:hypothetical protein n=1 Tax=Streptomyces sp. NPDC052040 TaxID=3365682 RepID=UPI0037D4DE61
MSRDLALNDLAAPLRALHLLAGDFGHLPAPMVDVNDIFPDRLKLSFHDGLSQFEAWREALGVDFGAVAYGTQGEGDRTCALKMSTVYAGAVLELVAYADVPLAAPAETDEPPASPDPLIVTGAVPVGGAS